MKTRIGLLTLYISLLVMVGMSRVEYLDQFNV